MGNTLNGQWKVWKACKSRGSKIRTAGFTSFPKCKKSPLQTQNFPCGPCFVPKGLSVTSVKRKRRGSATNDVQLLFMMLMIIVLASHVCVSRRIRTDDYKEDDDDDNGDDNDDDDDDEDDVLAFYIGSRQIWAASWWWRHSWGNSILPPSLLYLQDNLDEKLSSEIQVQERNIGLEI